MAATTSITGPSKMKCEMPFDPNALSKGFLPYEEFVQRFALGGASTEQLHEKTKTLSQTMQADVVKGLEMLFEIDQAVPEGLERFTAAIDQIAPVLATRLHAGGCIYFVGAGSSGRIAIDIASKCPLSEIRGVIAGGDSAMVRAREGFEDSESEGARCLLPFDLNGNDSVFLISSSGSASFNVGCGHFAANLGAHVYYFYNSANIPVRTQELFQRINNPVQRLELDIGPQAIGGSTRLQGASLAEICLGGLLGATLLYREGKDSDAHAYPRELLIKIREGNALIAKEMETIAQFVRKEADVFLSPSANFRRLKDETTQGHVTLIGGKKTLREILMDATETSPTFSVNPIQRETETEQKRAEFRAYLVGERDNDAAWRALLGREIETDAVSEISQFILAIESEGVHSYAKQPRGPGNFVLGVVKMKDDCEDISDVLGPLHEVCLEKGNTGLILLSQTKAPLLPPWLELTLCLEGVPSDSLGIVETLVLKQILNLISNGTMILAGKVHGNRMIDHRLSNQKLVDRCMRLIKEIWCDFGRSMPLTDKELYHIIAHVSELKDTYASEGIYTPSVMKIVLTLMYFEKKPQHKEFQEVLDYLAARKEALHFQLI